jgi:hypothetical protein
MAQAVTVNASLGRMAPGRKRLRTSLASDDHRPRRRRDDGGGREAEHSVQVAFPGEFTSERKKKSKVSSAFACTFFLDAEGVTSVSYGH